LCLPQNYANTFIEKLDQVTAYRADELVNNRRSEIEIIQTPVTINPGGTGKVIFHKVKRGETLSDVAARYGVSSTKMKKWNHLKRNTIQVGQRLKILK